MTNDFLCPATIQSLFSNSNLFPQHLTLPSNGGSPMSDFIEFQKALVDLAKKAKRLNVHYQNEENVKNVLVLPFIKALGFDIHSLDALWAEYSVCDKHNANKGRVDYALVRGHKPIIFIECKTNVASPEDNIAQLSNYIEDNYDEVKVAILTNGIKFLVFSNLDHPDSLKLDDEPYLTLDLSSFSPDLDQDVLKAIFKLSREQFNLESIQAEAAVLKSKLLFRQLFIDQIHNPSDDLALIFLQKTKYRSSAEDDSDTASSKASPTKMTDELRQEYVHLLMDALDYKEPNAVLTSEEIEQVTCKITSLLASGMPQGAAIDLQDYKESGALWRRIYSKGTTLAYVQLDAPKYLLYLPTEDLDALEICYVESLEELETKGQLLRDYAQQKLITERLTDQDKAAFDQKLVDLIINKHNYAPLRIASKLVTAADLKFSDHTYYDGMWRRAAINNKTIAYLYLEGDKYHVHLPSDNGVIFHTDKIRAWGELDEYADNINQYLRRRLSDDDDQIIDPEDREKFLKIALVMCATPQNHKYFNAYEYTSRTYEYLRIDYRDQELLYLYLRSDSGFGIYVIHSAGHSEYKQFNKLEELAKYKETILARIKALDES